MPRVCGPKINPAKFNKRVVLQSLTSEPDGQGGFSESWADTLSLWASIKPIKAFERMQAMQLETPITHKVMIRYNALVDTVGRIVYNDRVFNIVGVINVGEQDAFMEVTCVEVEGVSPVSVVSSSGFDSGFSGGFS